MTIYVIAEFPRFLFKFNVKNRDYSSEEFNQLLSYPSYCILSGEESYFSVDFTKDVAAFAYNIFFNPLENFIRSTNNLLNISKVNYIYENKYYYTAREITNFLNNEYHSHPLLVDTNYKNSSFSLIGFAKFIEVEVLFEELNLSEVAIINDSHYNFDINFYINKLNEDNKDHLLSVIDSLGVIAGVISSACVHNFMRTQMHEVLVIDFYIGTIELIKDSFYEYESLLYLNTI